MDIIIPFIYELNFVSKIDMNLLFKIDDKLIEEIEKLGATIFVSGKKAVLLKTENSISVSLDDVKKATFSNLSKTLEKEFDEVVISIFQSQVDYIFQFFETEYNHMFYIVDNFLKIIKKKGMRSEKFSLIMAIDSNNGIAKDGKIPWDLPEDMRHFRITTKETEKDKINAVIMGYSTFLTLSYPLVGRLNIVITSKKMQGYGNVIFLSKPEDALYMKNPKLDKFFLIGGKRIFEIDNCYIEKYYITKLEKNYDCDVIVSLKLEDCKIINKVEQIGNYSITTYLRSLNESTA